MNELDNNDEWVREKLAAIEHERWSDWQKWCHKVLRDLVPSAALEKVLERWDKQIATPYSKLTPEEQASDMEQVDRYWPLIQKYCAEQVRLGRIDELNNVMGNMGDNRDCITCYTNNTKLERHYRQLKSTTLLEEEK